MNLTKWDPLRELDEMAGRFGHLFGRPFPLMRRDAGRENLTMADWVPAVDISETAESFKLKVELPEVKKEDVHVTLENGMLTIQGERRQEKEEKDTRMHRVECSYGSFLRSFQVPENVDGTRIDAEFKDGMLLVTLPKTEAAAPKVTEVQIH